MGQDKVAVVTGAGRGSGPGVALGVAAARARVVVNDDGIDLRGAAPASGPAFEVVAQIAGLFPSTLGMDLANPNPSKER